MFAPDLDSKLLDVAKVDGGLDVELEPHLPPAEPLDVSHCLFERPLVHPDAIEGTGTTRELTRQICIEVINAPLIALFRRSSRLRSFATELFTPIMGHLASLKPQKTYPYREG